MAALKPSPPSAQPFGPCPALREVSSLTLPCGCDLGQTSILTADPWTRDGPPCLSVVPEGCLPPAHNLRPCPGPCPQAPSTLTWGCAPHPLPPVGGPTCWRACPDQEPSDSSRLTHMARRLHLLVGPGGSSPKRAPGPGGFQVAPGGDGDGTGWGMRGFILEALWSRARGPGDQQRALAF